MLARSAMTAAAALAVAGTGWSQWTAIEEAKVTASDAAAFDSFGYSVSISGNTALVGAPLDDHQGGMGAGSGYVLVRNGTSWIEQAKLTASNAVAYDSFGTSVSISGDTALVGVVGGDQSGVPDSGSAYVFVRSGTSWAEQAKLIASDAASFDSFGHSVSISGDTAVVGAHYDDHAGLMDAGSAYVFVRNGIIWTEQAKLTASDAAASDIFGISVGVSGDTVVVGAYFDDHTGGSKAGSAYVFVRNGTTWTEQAKLTANDAASYDYFGVSASISGETALVGAYWDDHAGGTDAGSTYAFVRNGTSWTEQAKLIGSDVVANDRFGYSVSVRDDTAVVGAYRDDLAGGTDVGSAYVFVRSGTSWFEEAKLTASDAATRDWFGSSVSHFGDTAVVGAYRDDHAGGVNAGSACVFRLYPSPTTYCTAGTSASGCQAMLSTAGTPSASAPSGFSLHAATVEGSKDGGFFWGVSGQQANPWGTGTSYQCVVPPVTRGGLLSGAGTVGTCAGSSHRT